MAVSQHHSPSTMVYPVADGEPLAETYDHLYAILVTLEVLPQYLCGQQATVLAKHFYTKPRGCPDGEWPPM